MAELSARAREVLVFIVAHKLQTGGDSPSFRQIVAGCRLCSTSTVTVSLRELQRAGLVEPAGGKSWRAGIRVKGGEWRLAAGRHESLRAGVRGAGGRRR